jgi:UDPglucose 6-dehydrogenase/GDP-mannose 6-dehydrogenase
MEVNSRQPDRVIELLGRSFADLRDLPVTILGLSFKPDTDDVRESPAFPIIDRLLSAGARLTAYDPVAMPAAARRLDGKPVRFAENLPAALDGAAAVILVTRWEEFRAVPQLLSALPAPPLFVDGRRMLDKGEFSRYAGIGL